MSLTIFVRFTAQRSARFNATMNPDDNKAFLTHYSPINGVDYIFASVGRYLSGDECDQLHQKYFEAHREITASNEWFFIDLRPAFRKPLSDVTPKFRRVSADRKFVE